VRAATAPPLQPGADPLAELGVLVALAVVSFVAGAYAIPWTE
ncbi:MAG: ABC transporter permease, partial [Halobacteriaceae archaeon]